jgi:hypothetical protein
MKKNRFVTVSNAVIRQKDLMWAIGSKFGWYTGTWQTRKEAIKTHCSLKGKTWEECKRDGDYVSKVALQEIE